MSLCYSQRDAERWAAFSGDYNPIHFDAAKARHLGMDGLCVHGMRAMLDVKSGLSQVLEKHALSTGGLRFSSRLREPVLCAIPYQLSLSETRIGELIQVGSKLLNAHTQRTSISSRLVEAKPLVLSPVTQAKSLRGEALAALYRHFQGMGNPSTPLWSFLDAVLFRELVNSPESIETVNSIIPAHKAASLGEVFNLVQVVQTHHDTYFSPRLLLHERECPRFKSLYYSIQPTLVMGEKEVGLVLMAGIQAWRVNEPLISVTVTLKTGPLAA